MCKPLASAQLRFEALSLQKTLPSAAKQQLSSRNLSHLSQKGFREFKGHICLCVSVSRVYKCMYVCIYIYGTPPPCTHACLPNLGFGKGWVLELQDGVG